jgi:hypothetical protein
MRRKPNTGAPGEDIAEYWYKQLEWSTNETLQQHRLAHEEFGWGNGTWKNCTDYVPVTAKGEVLGPLDVRDYDHPVLCSPTITRRNTEKVAESDHKVATGNESPVSEDTHTPYERSPGLNIYNSLDSLDKGSKNLIFLQLRHLEENEENEDPNKNYRQIRR